MQYALAYSVNDWEDKLWNCAVLDGTVGKLIFQLGKCSRDDRTWHHRQLNAVPGLVKKLDRKIWNERSKKWFLESVFYRGLKVMVTHGDWIHGRWFYRIYVERHNYKYFNVFYTLTEKSEWLLVSIYIG